MIPQPTGDTPTRCRVAASALLTFTLCLAIGRPLQAQVESPVPEPVPSVAAPLPAAGLVPATIVLDVTGSPADAGFLDTQIRAALDRVIRPTLRPGAGMTYGPIVPWPIVPLVPGGRAAVDVTVAIAGDATSSPVGGVTEVVLDDIVAAPKPPVVLYLDDDPEYLQTEGLAFRGDVNADRPARLYYYHDDIGVPRDVDVVLTATVPSRVQLIGSDAGPDLDVMSAGHSVSRDFVRYETANAGVVADIVPGRPYVVRHALVLQGEVVAGALDVQLLRGTTVSVSVVATPAGGRPDAYLDGPRMAFDGRRRHGSFDLTSFGAITASYAAGGADAAVAYGGRDATPRNLDPTDGGRDYGDYGVVHRITFALANPTGDPHVVYLYAKPLGGPLRGSFFIDGTLKELGCVRLPQRYWLSSYQLAPHSTGSSTTLTMPDGGSFYPAEFGVTETQPFPYAPPVGSPDGCSPVLSPTTPDPTS